MHRKRIAHYAVSARTVDDLLDRFTRTDIDLQLKYIILSEARAKAVSEPVKWIAGELLAIVRARIGFA